MFARSNQRLVLVLGVMVLIVASCQFVTPATSLVPASHAPRVAPLTGRLAIGPLERPALAVKIDNVSAARPQIGLGNADLVYEEQVEGGLSRYIAVFHSTVSDPVGPIRSARTSDLHILANLNGPLFAFSGGNPRVLADVAASTLNNVSAQKAGGAYFRSSARRAPHNLYSRTSSLWAAAPAGASAPPPLFEYRRPGSPLAPTAVPAAGVDVSYGNAQGSFVWNGSGWHRYTAGKAQHDATSGAALAPENVVVQFTNYRPSTADARSPEAIVSGSGPAWFFMEGHVIAGTWSRATDSAPTVYTDLLGEPVLLTPGRTWVMLPPPGHASLRS